MTCELREEGGGEERRSRRKSASLHSVDVMQNDKHSKSKNEEDITLLLTHASNA